MSMISSYPPKLITHYLNLFLVAAVTVVGAPQSDKNEYYCGWETYGSPRIQDCRPLLESFANYQDNSIRFFDEEQLRADKSGSWPGATSILGPMQLSQAIQVPRYYTLSMGPCYPPCRFDWCADRILSFQTHATSRS